MTPSSKALARTLISNVHAYGQLTVKGLEALAVVRDAVQLFSERAGFRLEFDPESDPKLVDYIMTAALGALQGAAIGGLAGLLLGLLVDEPGMGAALGVGLGAAVGGLSGVDHVNAGWRIRATFLPDGSPLLLIQGN